MGLTPADDEVIRACLEGPIETRLRATLAAVVKADNDIADDQLVDLGPLAHAIALLAGDIQAMPTQDGQRLAPAVASLSDGLGALADGLSARVKAHHFPGDTAGR